MKYSVCFAAVSSAFLATAGAVTPISFTGSDYTQNFDNLPSTGTTPVIGNATIPAPGKGPIDVPTSTTGTSLDGWTFANTPAGSGANAIFGYNDGASNSGAVYSYGTAGSTDRALGSLASGSTVSDFGLTLVNNSAGIFTSFTLAYTGEQWRYGGNTSPGDGGTVVNTLGFSYAIGATNLETGTFTSVSGLSFSSIINANPDPTKLPSEATALNGNAATNQTNIMFTVSGLLWNPGTTLTLKWSDINDVGNDNGLAVDNLTFAAISTTVNTVVWNTTGGTWDTTTPNWTGASTTFANGDIAQFTDAHVGVVNIDAGGVAPALVEVKNTTGTYTFNGGALTGNGSLIKTGAGTVILNVENQMTGGLDIQAGTFKTGNSDVLSDSAPVKVGAGATLDLQDNVDAIGALTLKGGTVASGPDGLLTLGGNVIVEANAQTAYLTGKLNTGSPAHTVLVGDGASAIDLQIDAALTGGSRLTFNGEGTTALNGDNSSFTGGISLNTGKLLLGNASALGTGSFFFNGGTVVASTNLTGVNAITNPVSAGGNVTIDGTMPIEFTKLTNNFGNAAKTTTIIGSVTFSGVMPDGTGTNFGVLNKLGSGTLTLTAVNTYTGATTVQAGVLVISSTGAIGGSSTLSVSAGATLELQNAVSLNNFIRLNLVTGSIVDLDFVGVETIGILAINGTLLGTDNYTLAELQALFGGVTFTGDAGASFEVTNVVPEPGTVGLLLMGLGAVVLAIRRRPAQA